MSEIRRGDGGGSVQVVDVQRSTFYSLVPLLRFPSEFSDSEKTCTIVNQIRTDRTINMCRRIEDTIECP